VRGAVDALTGEVKPGCPEVGRDAVDRVRVDVVANGGRQRAAVAQTHVYARDAVGDESDPAVDAFRIYTQVMRFNEGDRERLRALVEGVQMALIGTGGPDKGLNEPSEESLQDAENTAGAGLSGDSWGETRTPDLTIMSRAL
jgi:hypothetical protein